MGKEWSKGQWKLSLFEDGAFTLWNRGTHKNMVICQRNQVPDDMIDEGVANAHLIAAAPELYGALAALLSRVGNDADAHAWFLEEQENAIKALSKARGETEERWE
jgi:hypothetical protein